MVFLLCLGSDRSQSWNFSLGARCWFHSFWMLIPDKLDDETDSINKNLVFLVQPLFYFSWLKLNTNCNCRFSCTLWQYFLVGTTVGMMIANAPAVFIGWQNVYLSHLFIKLVLPFSRCVYASTTLFLLTHFKLQRTQFECVFCRSF